MLAVNRILLKVKQNYEAQKNYTAVLLYDFVFKDKTVSSCYTVECNSQSVPLKWLSDSWALQENLFYFARKEACECIVDTPALNHKYESQCARTYLGRGRRVMTLKEDSD